MNKEQTKNRIAELTSRGWWYQDVKINGLSVPLRYPKTINSKFHHFGKWDTFIKILLPFDDFSNRVFVEYGSNAGLNLLEAAKMGFSKVVGIEADNNFFAQGKFVIDENISFDNIKLFHRCIGEPEPNVHAACASFSFDEIPLADLSLLANFHYWIETSTLKKFVDDLALKSYYAIIISTVESANYPTSSTMGTVENLFENKWTLIGSISQVPIENDSSPRNLYALLFRSNVLLETTVQEVKNKVQIDARTEEFINLFTNFLKQFQNGQASFPEFIAYLKRYPIKDRYNEEKGFTAEIEHCCEMFRSISKDGLKDSIKLFMNGKKLDISGWHRLVIAEYLKWDRIYVEHCGLLK